MRWSAASLNSEAERVRKANWILESVSIRIHFVEVPRIPRWIHLPVPPHPPPIPPPHVVIQPTLQPSTLPNLIHPLPREPQKHSRRRGSVPVGSERLESSLPAQRTRVRRGENGRAEVVGGQVGEGGAAWGEAEGCDGTAGEVEDGVGFARRGCGGEQGEVGTPVQKTLRVVGRYGHSGPAFVHSRRGLAQEASA